MRPPPCNDAASPRVHLPQPASALLPPPLPCPIRQVGGLLVDGLGDGAMIEAAGEDMDFLRTTGFGLLQVRGGGRVHASW